MSGVEDLVVDGDNEIEVLFVDPKLIYVFLTLVCADDVDGPGAAGKMPAMASRVMRNNLLILGNGTAGFWRPDIVR